MDLACVRSGPISQLLTRSPVASFACAGAPPGRIYPLDPREEPKMAVQDRISEIASRVDAGGRITVDDAALLWEHASDETLMRMASAVRARHHAPGHATYLVMRIIN